MSDRIQFGVGDADGPVEISEGPIVNKPRLLVGANGLDGVEIPTAPKPNETCAGSGILAESIGSKTALRATNSSGCCGQ